LTEGFKHESRPNNRREYGRLSRSFSAATVPRLLWRPEAASLTSTVALTLALTLALTRAREPAALGPVAIPAVPGIAADIAAVANEAAATGSRPVPAATTATAELVAGVVAPTARLTDGEVGWAPFVLLTLDTRQLRADQRTVDRAFFRIGEAGLGVRRLHIGARLAASGKHRRLEGRWRFRRGLAGRRRRGPAHHRRGGQIVAHNAAGVAVPVVPVSPVILSRPSNGQVGCGESFPVIVACWHVSVGLACQHFLEESRRAFLLASARGLTALVRMLGIAGRTPRLFDGLFNHGDDRVIRHTTLTRAIVIQNVSETQPALLHSISPELFPFERGWKRLPDAGFVSLAEPLPPVQESLTLAQISGFTAQAKPSIPYLKILLEP
jgi:hypothetical protein